MEDHGVGVWPEVLDLYPAFKDVKVKEIRTVPLLDGHPNAKGHSITADALYNYFTSENLLHSQSF